MMENMELRLISIGLLCLNLATIARAGFFTFYFPNALKPRGYNELSDMIERLDTQIKETKDQFSDVRYFWGQMQNLDEQLKEAYPEPSVCSELFPQFRDMAIDYSYIDFDHFIKPFEEYQKHLVNFTAKFYPAGMESKAALPREWEQNLLKFELENKIKWFDALANNEDFRNKRQMMVDIWKKVRRNLDHSLPCIYMRYAYRQVADDISQVALDANLDGLKEAQKVLLEAYKRIEKFKKSDAKIVSDIVAEIEKEQRFTIKT